MVKNHPRVIVVVVVIKQTKIKEKRVNSKNDKDCEQMNLRTIPRQVFSNKLTGG